MKHLVLLAVASLPALVAAQAAPESLPKEAKAPVTAKDYGRFERLSRAITLSSDGAWLTYQISRVDGTGDLRVCNLASRGERVFENGSGAQFSADNRWCAFRIGYSEAEAEKLTKAKKPVENKLGLFDLKSGKLVELEKVQSFAFSEAGTHLAMLRYRPKDRKDGGSDLVVRELATGTDTSFGNVGQWRWSDRGDVLALTLDTADRAGNGVQVYDARRHVLLTLDSAHERYTNLTWRKDAMDLAVLREKKHGDDEDATITVLAFPAAPKGAARRRVYDHLADSALAKELRVVPHAGLRWSDDGSTLFFGLAGWENRPDLDKDKGKDKDKDKKVPSKLNGSDEAVAKKKKDEPSKKSAPLKDRLDEPAGVEVWHTADIDIIPRQKKTLDRDRKRSFLTAWAIKKDHVVQLGNELTEDVYLLERQRHALGADNTPYETEKRFSATVSDLYLIDVRSGKRDKVLERIKYQLGSSPDGRWFVYAKDGFLWSFDTKKRTSHCLTKTVDRPFFNDERVVLTDEPPPYGISGWLKDSSRVLLRSRHDIWSCAPDGSRVERITKGREDLLRYRRVRLDPDEDRFIDPSRPIWYEISGDTSKKSGFLRHEIGGASKRVVFKDAATGGLARAEKAQTFAWVEGTFDDSPDVFVASDNTLTPARQVSKTNAFQSEYAWGHSELVDFENEHGKPLQGALFYPAGYEEGRQYPMIVYIYERVSDGLHRYTVPSERDAYNTAVFTSEGYFVLRPDIVYRAQNPGLSALECVVPAVKAVLAKGIVDEKRVGLVGHSWGAYQTSFIVTHTDVFAAGVAGAPLTNMMSMSMSIYWNTGQTDAYIFHESQGRMDQPFWLDVDTYIKNSPIFGMETWNSPLMIAFGDNDGAVDWHQGIEMYNAARLAQKPLVMLVYPGENHGLRKKPNRVDYHWRIREWFGHYLKGDPAPAWITKGMPWLERQRELEALKRKKKGGEKKPGK